MDSTTLSTRVLAVIIVVAVTISHAVTLIGGTGTTASGTIDIAYDDSGYRQTTSYSRNSDVRHFAQVIEITLNESLSLTGASGAYFTVTNRTGAASIKITPDETETISSGELIFHINGGDGNIGHTMLRYQQNETWHEVNVTVTGATDMFVDNVSDYQVSLYDSNDERLAQTGWRAHVTGYT